MRFSIVSFLPLLGWASANGEPPVPDQRLEPNYTSPAGVDIYNPSNFFTTTGPWSLMSHAGDTLYVAGMRGIHPENSTLAPVGMPRVRQAFQNMKTLAEWAGADLTDCGRIVVYTTDMYRYRPMCNQVQIELWGDDPNTYPPRTIIEVDRLNEDDIVEVEGTFYLPRSKCKPRP